MHKQLALLIVTATLGVVTGAATASYGSKALELTGIFKYEPEDEQESKPVSRPDCISFSTVDDFLESTRTIALESSGDITLSTTYNPLQFDHHSRAFQLLQYRSFLEALKNNQPNKSDVFATNEYQLMQDFVSRAAKNLQDRLAKA